MHVSDIEAFCGGGKFWDAQVTWNTTNPDFTECFQKTTFSWIPSLFLFLLSPVEIYELCREKRGRIPWTILNFTKMVLCVILALLALMNVTNSAIRSSENVYVPKVDFFTPLLQFFTFMLVFGFTFMERRKGIQSSGVQFFFWLVSAVMGALVYRSFILKASDETSVVDSVSYVTEMIKYPIVLVLFVLTWISDALPIQHKIYQSNEKPCPELLASFPSCLFFTWLDRLVYTGSRRDLERKDLWDLNPVNKTRPVYDAFYKHWRHELKKFSLTASSCSTEKNTINLRKTDENLKEPSLLKVLVRSFGLLYFFAILLKLISDFLLFVNPLVLNLLISFVESDEPQWKGFLYAFTMLTVAIVNVTIVARASHISYVVGMRVRSALIAAIYRKAMRLSNSGKRRYTLGEIVNLMSVDVQKMMDVVLYFIFVCTSPILFSVTMYLLWQRLGVAVLAGIAAMIIVQSITVMVLDYAKRLQIDQMKLKDNRIKLMNEILNGIKVLKLYGWEKCFMEIINGIRSREVGVLRKSSSFGLAMTFSWYTSSVLVTLTSFATYVLMDPTHVLDANIAFVSFALFNVMQGPVMLMPMVIVTIIQASVSMKRIARFLYCEEIDPDAVQYVHDEEHSVTIENGSFNWGDHDLTILSDINLRVKEKSLVAVVGTVGAGKSSLLSAILGEMEKSCGRVTVSGSVAYVPQQAWLQNATLKDNIVFGKVLNGSFYEKVVDGCALRPDLQVLPAGDSTEIGEKGINLSGGQKHRISLARAVYSDANIYLMDDPLSAVDVHVGKHIFDRVIGPKGILKDKTRILVTHRITLLPQVDLIVVVNNGVISEIGTYRELLDRKGVFAEFLMTYLTDVEETKDEKDEGIDEVKPESLRKTSAITKELSLSRSYGYNEIESKASLNEVDSKSFQRQFSVPNLSKYGESSDSNEQRRFSSYSITNLSLESLSRPHMNSQIITDVPIVSGSLIVAESMEMGKVKLSTYSYYARAIGFKTIFFTILFYMMAYGCSMGSSIWLSMWSNDAPNADGTQDEALRNLRLIVYGTLGLSFASLSLLGGIVFVYGTTFASGNLHRMLLDNIVRSPMSFFDTTPLGRIINRFSKDIDILDITLPQWLQQWLSSLFQVTATIIVISISTPVFVLFALPIGVIYYYLQRFYVASSRQLKRLESVTRSPIYSHFSESVIGAAIVRAFGRQASFIRQSEEKVDENQLCYYPSIIANRWIGIRLEIIGNVLVFCAALLAVLGRETLSPGLVGLSVSYSLSITFILNWVVRMTSEVETNIVAVERVKEYSVTPTEAAWEITESKPTPMWPTNGEVTFNGYSTRYRQGLDLVLRKATFSIRSGEKVGIVGRTGAGKSSLTLALFRIIEAASGNIVIDGIDIAKLGLHDLRSRLTIIPQEPVLFSGSLRMNLDPFDHHSDEEIWRVLELSHLKGFTSMLSKGLMHEISEGGDNLSVGQRQLVCLARALLRKTKILILDEATAAVDLETDDLIQATIRKEFTDCTVLTIAHRLNTIIDNDRVLVLDHGIIKEFDSPQALTAKKSTIFYGMARDAGLVASDTNT